MANPATIEKISSNPATTTAPRVRAGSVHRELPDSFFDAPKVSPKPGNRMARWAQKYGEFKLTTGYWIQFRI